MAVNVAVDRQPRRKWPNLNFTLEFVWGSENDMTFLEKEFIYFLLLGI